MIQSNSAKLCDICLISLSEHLSVLDCYFIFGALHNILIISFEILLPSGVDGFRVIINFFIHMSVSLGPFLLN